MECSVCNEVMSQEDWKIHQNSHGGRRTIGKRIAYDDQEREFQKYGMNNGKKQRYGHQTTRYTMLSCRNILLIILALIGLVFIAATIINYLTWIVETSTKLYSYICPIFKKVADFLLPAFVTSKN